MDVNIDVAKRSIQSLNGMSQEEAIPELAEIIVRLMKQNGLDSGLVFSASDAVERREYATMELSSSLYGAIFEQLLEIGFGQEEKYFYHTELGVAVAIIDSPLEGYLNEVVTIGLDKNTFMNFLTIEDAVLYNLKTGLELESEEELSLAFRLFVNNHDMINIADLKEECSPGEDTLLDEWMEELGI